MQPTKGKRTKPVATSIIYDFMFNINPESWETKDASKEARRVAQISWIIDSASECQIVSSNVRWSGSRAGCRFTSFKHSLLRHEMSASACHTRQILLLRSLGIPIQTNHGSNNMQIEMFQFFLLFATKMQAYFFFFTEKYLKPAKVIFQLSSWGSWLWFVKFLLPKMLPMLLPNDLAKMMMMVMMTIMMDACGRFVIPQNASPYCS